MTDVDPVGAFAALDMRVGRVVRAEPHERARKLHYAQLATG